jgi:VWFA-related protein
LLATALPALASAQTTPEQVPPVFRGGVDLITTDVTVTDGAGRPVTDLRLEDFRVAVDGRPRSLVSAEFIAARPAPAEVAGGDLGPVSGPDSNTEPLAGRTIIFVVDVDEIRFGEGRAAMAALADYADGLGPTDRVGLVALPSGRPRVDATTDRRVLRESLSQITGISSRQRRPEMSPGEAAHIAAGQTAVAETYLRRVRAGDCTLRGDRLGQAAANLSFDARLACREVAEKTLEIYRGHSIQVLSSLRGLVELLGTAEGPKVLVFVSEGLLIDDKTARALQEFTRAAERARVVLHALQLDVASNLAENRGAAGANADSTTLDQRIGFDGFTALAEAARGRAVRVIADPTAALDQLAAELGGYYLLSFEREPSDPEGGALRLGVEVARPDLHVRRRARVTGEPAARLELPRVSPDVPEADARAAMVELLHAPVLAGGVRLDVDSFAVPIVGRPNDVRTVIAAEVEHDGARVISLGFEVLTDQGALVADNFVRHPDLQPVTDSRALFLAPAVLPPGRYRIKLGVVDDQGRRGSVEHPFEVRPWAPGAPVRISEVVLADGRDGRLVARDPGARLAARVEIHADAPEAFLGYSAAVSVGRLEAEGVQWFADGDLELLELGALQRGAQAVLNTGDFPPGRYVVRFTIAAPGGETHVLARTFRK